MQLRLRTMADVRLFSLTITMIAVVGNFVLQFLIYPPGTIAELWFPSLVITVSLSELTLFAASEVPSSEPSSTTMIFAPIASLFSSASEITAPIFSASLKQGMMMDRVVEEVVVVDGSRRAGRRWREAASVSLCALAVLATLAFSSPRSKPR